MGPIANTTTPPGDVAVPEADLCFLSRTVEEFTTEDTEANRSAFTVNHGVLCGEICGWSRSHLKPVKPALHFQPRMRIRRWHVGQRLFHRFVLQRVRKAGSSSVSTLWSQSSRDQPSEFCDKMSDQFNATTGELRSMPVRHGLTPGCGAEPGTTRYSLLFASRISVLSVKGLLPRTPMNPAKPLNLPTSACTGAYRLT